MGLRTLVLPKGTNSLDCFASSITGPGVVSACICFAANTDGNLVLALYRTAIKDKEWCSVIGLPSVQLLVDVFVDSHGAAQGSEEGFGFEEACKKVVGVNSGSVVL